MGFDYLINQSVFNLAEDYLIGKANEWEAKEESQAPFNNFPFFCYLGKEDA